MYSSWLNTLILCKNIYILNPKAFKDSFALSLSPQKRKKCEQTASIATGYVLNKIFINTNKDEGNTHVVNSRRVPL